MLAAFAGGLAMLFLVLEQRPGGWWRIIDIAVGALACIALLFRRRAPITIGLILAVAAAFCATAGVANYVALFAVARHRRLEQAIMVALVDIVGSLGFWLLYPANSALSLTIVVNTAIALAVVAWGALQKTQQDLVVVYRDRAARIVRERELRAEQIQMAERARIARDMHDSVAHYISLIALYAGGLEVAGENAKNVSHTAATIRTTATSALSELRTVIGMLRDGTLVVPEETSRQRTVENLVDQARQAGQIVVAHLDRGVVQEKTAATDEVYRIVQEGLTNARKHAPGAMVTVNVHLDEADVVIAISNPVGDSAAILPGSGAGLVGLAERVSAIGGVLEHEIIDHGDGKIEFRLQGRVPA